MASELNMTKYKAVRTELDGHVFDSEKEMRRWQDLRLLERAGAILNLQRQVSFDLYGANGERVARYVADFTYRDLRIGKYIVEDVKSPMTRKLPIYRLKAKLMIAVHGLRVLET